jgi:hypothetical protein
MKDGRGYDQGESKSSVAAVATVAWVQAKVPAAKRTAYI